MSRSGTSRLCLWMALSLLAVSAGAQAPDAAAPRAVPALIPMETLFAHDDVGAAKLSPDGNRIAIALRIKGRMVLTVHDLETGTGTQVAQADNEDISWYRWVNNQRLLFGTEDQQAAEHDNVLSDNVYAVDAAGGKVRRVALSVYQQIYIQGLITVKLRFPMEQGPVPGSDDILMGSKVASQHGVQKGISIWRVDTKMLTEDEVSFGIGGRIVDGYSDWRGRLRAVRVVDGDGITSLRYRSDDNAPWQTLPDSHPIFKGEGMEPEGFSPDGKTMWVSAYNGRDKRGLWAYDLDAKKIGDAIYLSDKADLAGGLVIDPLDGRLLGISVEAMAPEFHWFDPKWQAMQDMLDRALPFTVNRISGDLNKRVLIHAYSERIPGRYYLFDVEKRRLQEKFRQRPKLDAKQLADTGLMQYTARDGLPLHALLTLPPGRGDKKLPLVVLPHGGPYARDYWAFDPEVQMLANRGYAVLQPQFRGTTGFGYALFAGGHKTWGLSMQDDLEDGVNALAAKGTVDKARVCIWGSSYGGYAALMGAVKTPDLYRCVISFAGITDIGLKFTDDTSDYADSLWRDYGMETFIGDPKALQAQFEQTSPAKQAAKIKAPVLLVWADKDRRVTPKHAKAMLSALQGQGKTVQPLVLHNEEHGIMKLENRLEYRNAVEAFLKRYNPTD